MNPSSETSAARRDYSPDVAREVMSRTYAFGEREGIPALLEKIGQEVLAKRLPLVHNSSLPEGQDLQEQWGVHLSQILSGQVVGMRASLLWPELIKKLPPDAPRHDYLTILVLSDAGSADKKWIEVTASAQPVAHFPRLIWLDKPWWRNELQSVLDELVQKMIVEPEGWKAASSTETSESDQPPAPESGR